MGLEAKFKEKVAALVARLGYKRLDDYLTRRWPRQWAAVCAASKGWKTITGAVILSWPAIVASVSAIAVHFNLGPEDIARAIGVTLLILGVADKVLKFWVTLEWGSEEEHRVEHESQILADEMAAQAPANFKAEYHRLLEAGKSPDEAWRLAREKTGSK